MTEKMSFQLLLEDWQLPEFPSGAALYSQRRDGSAQFLHFTTDYTLYVCVCDK